jgi:hypothetical protein
LNQTKRTFVLLGKIASLFFPPFSIFLLAKSRPIIAWTIVFQFSRGSLRCCFASLSSCNVCVRGVDFAALAGRFFGGDHEGEFEDFPHCRNDNAKERSISSRGAEKPELADCRYCWIR